jgi:DNA processing protein
LVTRAEEIVELVGKAGELADELEHPSSPLDELTEVGKRVYEALPGRGVRSTDELSIESGLPVAQLQGQLALLELAGLAVRDDGRWRINRRRT